MLRVLRKVKATELQKKYMKAYYERNKERILAKSKTLSIQNREHRKAYNKEYRLSHKEDLLRRITEFRDRTLFGGQRKNVLHRDGWKCTQCGITNEECLVKYKKGLSVHHIDGKGVNSEVQNNDLSNLTSVCNACHRSIEARRLWRERRSRRRAENKEKRRLEQL